MPKILFVVTIFLSFVLSLTIFLFNPYTPKVFAVECSIELKYSTPLTAASKIQGAVKAPTAFGIPTGAIAACTYDITISGTKILSRAVPGSESFNLGPGLDPGTYNIAVKSATSIVGPGQSLACGECSASFEVMAGTDGLSCYVCPTGYYYSDLQKVCYEEKTNTPATAVSPTAICPGVCNEDTKKCERGTPIQPPPADTQPKLSCCPERYQFVVPTKRCEAKPGNSGRGKYLCTSGYECNPSNQRCEQQKGLWGLTITPGTVETIDKNNSKYRVNYSVKNWTPNTEYWVWIGGDTLANVTRGVITTDNQDKGFQNFFYQIKGAGGIPLSTVKQQLCIQKAPSFSIAGSGMRCEKNAMNDSDYAEFKIVGIGGDGTGEVSGPKTSAAGILCNSGNGVETAIGCIPTEPQAFISALLKIGLGAGGGVAFLMMIFGVIQMITSAGNADQVKQGSERLTSAVIGLLFIIFATLLLQIIGVNILNIPEFKP